MEILKEVWQKPELTVLVRNKPEEAVLSACKSATDTDGPIEGNCDVTIKPPFPGGSPHCEVVTLT